MNIEYYLDRLIGISNLLTQQLFYNQTTRGMIGYLGGIIVFIVLGVKRIKGYELFFATAIINLICIALVIIFRILAKYMNGFWEIWWKRMQRQILAALSCLGHYTQMPEYQITTTTIDRYGNKTVSKSTTCNTFIYGCIQCVVCAVLTIISPFILAFVIFCYVQAIIHECRWREKQRAKNEVKEEEIARQSARMSLGVPLNKTNLSQMLDHNQSLANNYVNSYQSGQESGKQVKQVYFNNVNHEVLQNYPQNNNIELQQQNFQKQSRLQVEYQNVQGVNIKNDEL